METQKKGSDGSFLLTLKSKGDKYELSVSTLGLLSKVLSLCEGEKKVLETRLCLEGKTKHTYINHTVFS